MEAQKFISTSEHLSFGFRIQRGQVCHSQVEAAPLHLSCW